jgi:AcrR family transcriptional regulator
MEMEAAISEGRRARHKAAVAQRILDAAREAFVAVGVNDSDLADIAQRAKVGRATLYRYFDGKDALVGALIEEDWDRQADLFTRLVERPALNAEGLSAWLRTLIRATAARRTSFPIYFANARNFDMNTRLNRQRNRLMAILNSRFEGFSVEDDAAGMGGLLLLFEIEQFAAYAPMIDDPRQVEAGVALLTKRLAERLKPPR